MDKKIVALLVSVVLVISGGIAFMQLSKDGSGDTAVDTSVEKSEDKESDENDTSSSEISEIEDLGLCDLLEVSTIKSSLGAIADDVSSADNTGVVNLGDGDKGQTCVYPFVPSGNAENSFYVDLAAYTAESFDLVKDFTATSGVQVEGIGDRASFESGETGLGSTEFTLTVVVDTKVYLFVISQPTAETAFDEPTAQEALTEIARTANL